MQRLADVPQIGQPPFAVDAAQHPGRHAPLAARHFEQRGDTAGGEDGRPTGEVRTEAVGQGVTTGGEFRGGRTDERGEGRGPHTSGTMRLLDGLEQDLPLLAGGGLEDAHVAGDDGRDAGRREVVLDQARLQVGADDHRDVPGLDRRPVERRAAGQQVGDVRGQVAGDEGPGPVDRDLLVPAHPEVVAAQHAQPERRTRRRTHQPAALVVRCHLPYRDLRVAERESTQQLCRALTNGSSVRQLRVRVACAPAVRAADR